MRISDCHIRLRNCTVVTMQNRWNNRISDGCVYAQIRKGLGMHLVTYSNHDTVPFLLIVPIKGRFVRDGIHCVYIYQRLHDFLTFLEYLGNLVHFSIYKGWNFPFLLGDILNIPLKGSIQRRYSLLKKNCLLCPLLRWRLNVGEQNACYLRALISCLPQATTSVDQAQLLHPTT